MAYYFTQCTETELISCEIPVQNNTRYDIG